jgi:hypothetical protein
MNIFKQYPEENALELFDLTAEKKTYHNQTIYLSGSRDVDNVYFIKSGEFKVMVHNYSRDILRHEHSLQTREKKGPKRALFALIA